MKIAMIQIRKFMEGEQIITHHPSGASLEKGSIKSQLIMQVHDEVVFDIFP